MVNRATLIVAFLFFWFVTKC